MGVASWRRARAVRFARRGVLVRAGLGAGLLERTSGRRRSRHGMFGLAAPRRRPAQRGARLRLKPPSADAHRLLALSFPSSCSLFARSGVQPAAPAAVGVACRAVRGGCRVAGAPRAPLLAPARRCQACRLNAFLAARARRPTPSHGFTSPDATPYSGRATGSRRVGATPSSGRPFGTPWSARDRCVRRATRARSLRPRRCAPA